MKTETGLNPETISSIERHCNHAKKKHSEMRKLNRNECAILPLVLKGKWYDMIASGRKTEEYREHKPYWAKRIMRWLYDPREMHVVQFSRGYRKADMFFIGCVSFNTYIGAEHPEW